jgi:spore protease
LFIKIRFNRDFFLQKNYFFHEQEVIMQKNPDIKPNSDILPDIISEAQILDMATEAHKLLRGAGNTEISGVRHSEESFPCGKIITIEILNAEGARLMGRERGSYITIEIPQIQEQLCGNILEPVSAAIAKVISELLPPELQNGTQPILLVGLGNIRTTADSIGPRVIAHIQPTLHFFSAEYAAEIRPVAALSPGVVGNTGIETAALIKGVADQLQPAAIIAIDALAARSIGNIMSSIQICNTGIRPGSGVQNHRLAITQEYMGVPVLAIGIPTVVHGATIIRESTNLCMQRLGTTAAELPQQICEELLAPFANNLVVTPKEADELVKLAAEMIAAGLTRALHPGADAAYFKQYMQGV